MNRRRPTRGVPAPRRTRGDGGAVLVEFAAILPVLILLAMGLLEFGFGFRVHNTQSQATANAVRVLASAGFEAQADVVTLQALAAGLGDLPDRSTVEKVIVFDPTAIQWRNGACRRLALPPSGHGGIENACTVYAGTVLETLNPSNFTPAGASNCPGSSWDRPLCPVRRDADPGGGGTGRIGIQVVVRHDMLTGLFPPGELAMTETFEMCLEPAGPDAVVPPTNGGNATGECGT